MRNDTKQKRQFKIKDPGSAITHFIGCVMAILAGLPLLIKAAREHHCYEYLYFKYDTALCGKHDLPYRRFHGKGEQKTAKDRPHDDFYFNCRKLYAGMSDCSAGKNRDSSLRGCVDCGDYRNFDKSVLDYLSEVVFFCYLYWNGLALRFCLCSDCTLFSAGRFCLAFGRRRDLYSGRNYLRAEVADF